MIVIGALSALVAVSCLILSVRGVSYVERRLRWLARPAVRRSPLAREVDALVAARVVGGTLGAMVGAAATIVLGVAPYPCIVGAYVGAVVPAVVKERRDASRARAADRAVATLVEWLCALVGAGRPVEVALASALDRDTLSPLLDAALRQASREYTLGVPLHIATERAGEAFAIASLRALGGTLARARELGRGAAAMLADLRDDMRAAQRARAIRAASSVETKLMLIVTLCYLPALALLVIVPLFVTLLAGLFS